MASVFGTPLNQLISESKMKNKPLERYWTYCPKTQPAFHQFSAGSLHMRFDEIEIFVKNQKSVTNFIDLAEHHIQQAISYLRYVPSQWRQNILNGSLSEIHKITLAAAHYCHSRLAPAFHASNIAKADWLVQYQNYLTIEEKFIKELDMIKRGWDFSSKESSSQFGQTPSLPDDPILDLYESALIKFANELEDELEWALIFLKHSSP